MVSTGLPAVLIPIRRLRCIQQMRPRVEALEDLARSRQAGKTVLVFSAETLSPASQLHVRVFAPLVGVPEDPATGSANSCLAGYLVQHRYFGTDPIDIRVEQGYEMGRPSCLHLKAGQTPGSGIRVEVGGKVQLTAKGRLVRDNEVRRTNNE